MVIGLYPYWDISDEAIAAADRFLTAPDMGCLRYRRRCAGWCSRGRPAVKRALRARRFDAAGEG